MVLNEDDTGEVSDAGAVTWEYDEASHTLPVTLTENNWIEECRYMSDSDTIYVDQWTYSIVTE